VNVGVRSQLLDAAGDSDADLLAASARRDAQAFAGLVSRHYKPVYRMVWRMMNGNAEAEDVAQEAFIKLWQNPAQVREPSALKGWLMRVASNLAIDRMRRKPHEVLDVVENLPDESQRLASDGDGRAAQARVKGAIADLPERQRLALTLVYFEGMSNISAADVLEISVDAVESLLARAKRALREGLADDWSMLLEELNGEG
jgi:RNA polymerase sigma-70 factor, ECF subfamily